MPVALSVPLMWPVFWSMLRPSGSPVALNDMMSPSGSSACSGSETRLPMKSCGSTGGSMRGAPLVTICTTRDTDGTPAAFSANSIQ